MRSIGWSRFKALLSDVYASREGGASYPTLTYVKLLLLQQSRRSTAAASSSLGRPLARTVAALEATANALMRPAKPWARNFWSIRRQRAISNIPG